MNPTNRKKTPVWQKITILLTVMVLMLGVGAKLYWDSLKRPVNTDGQTIAFVIKKGDSVFSIAERLQQDKLIRSAVMFKFLAKSSGKLESVEPGDFKLSQAMSTAEIIDNLSQGPVDRWVTLIEGWRSEEIADQLNRKIGIDKIEFLKFAKEGYLFPDTYLFNPEAKSSDIVLIMNNTFNTKYDESLQHKIKSNGLTVDQGVILASIVEREARSDNVRSQVASILLKRFKIGMKLDVDATVQYAKDTQTLRQSGKLDKFWKPITQAEYRSVVSPFNTYLNPGLPPAPICNPSLSSLRAVAKADSATPYLYYYHDSQGNSYYSKTLEEHNKNAAEHQ